MTSRFIGAVLIGLLFSSMAHAGDIISLSPVGGWTPLRLSALTNAAVAIKPAAGSLSLVSCGNTNASEEFVQVFNIPAASVVVGTTLPILSLPMKASDATTIVEPAPGISLGGTGISVAATTTATGGSAPASALDCNTAYN